VRQMASKREFSDAELQGLSDRFKQQVQVKDRRWFFRVYKECFLGNEGVSWLLKEYQFKTRQEARHLGQLLMDRGVFSHVIDDQQFEDSKLYYRFNSPEVCEQLKKARSFLQKSGYLEKKGMTGWSVYWFEIRGTILKQYSVKDGPSRGKYNVLRCSLNQIPSGFEIHLFKGQIISLKAEDEKEKKSWITVLCKAKEVEKEREKMLAPWKQEEQCFACLAALASEQDEIEEEENIVKMNEKQEEDEKKEDLSSSAKGEDLSSSSIRGEDLSSISGDDLPSSSVKEIHEALKELLALPLADINGKEVNLEYIFDYTKSNVIVLALLRHFG